MLESREATDLDLLSSYGGYHLLQSELDLYLHPYVAERAFTGSHFVGLHLKESPFGYGRLSNSLSSLNYKNNLSRDC